MRDYPTLHFKTNYSKKETNSKKGIYVNQHERLSNITL